MSGSGFGVTPKMLIEYNILKNRGMEDAAINGTVATNMDKDFVRRIVSQNPSVSNYIATPDGNGFMTHFMANQDNYAFPTIVNEGGPNLRMIGRGERPAEVVNMGSPEAAEWFAENYKRANPNGFGLSVQDNQWWPQK